MNEIIFLGGPSAEGSVWAFLFVRSNPGLCIKNAYIV